MTDHDREQEARALFDAIRRRGQPEHVGAKRLVRRDGQEVPAPPTVVRWPGGRRTTYQLLTLAEVAQIAADAAQAGPLPPEPSTVREPTMGEQADVAQEGLLSMEAIVRHVQLRDRLFAILRGQQGATAEGVTDEELLDEVRRRLAPAALAPADSPPAAGGLTRTVMQLSDEVTQLEDERDALRSERDQARREAAELRTRLDQLLARVDQLGVADKAMLARVNELLRRSAEAREHLAQVTEALGLPPGSSLEELVARARARVAAAKGAQP